MKTKKQKKAELETLIVSVCDQIEGMPLGIKLLAKQAAKQLPEETIDKTIDGVLLFLSNVFVVLERIQDAQDAPMEVVPNPRDKQLALTA